MWIKWVVFIVFAAILASLAIAWLRLMDDKANPDAVLQALSWRIGLSILLFILLMLGIAAGFITPQSVKL